MFLDETGAKTNIIRLYGRSKKGKRCHDKAPAGRWGRVTVLSAMRLDGTAESIVFEGAINRRIFDDYIKNMLAPKLKAGDMLVLDNLSVHKSAAMHKALEERGATAKFLPVYSPDYNPAENMWSKVKQALKKIKPRSSEELFSAVGVALDLVTADDAKGWFKSCGYIPSQN